MTLEEGLDRLEWVQTVICTEHLLAVNECSQHS